MVRRFLALLLLALVPALAAQGRDWAPEDRLVLGDFSRIAAVAVSLDKVFVVTPTALLVYNPRDHRWEGVFSPGDAAQPFRDAVAAMADPLDNSAWVLTRGSFYHFDPAIRRWDSGSLPGVLSDVALDQDNPALGLFLRVGSGWYSATRGGVLVPTSAPRRPVRPATVDQAIRENPAIQASSGLLAVTGRRAGLGYTSAARAQGFAGMGWYLGTNGAGLVYFSEGSGRPELLPFGLPGDRVDAVTAGPDGVWAVTERSALADAALTFVARDLREVRSYQGPRATGMPFTEARRVLSRDDALWIATGTGVVRYRPREDEVTRFSAGRELPDGRTYDLAQRQGRLVIATARGLAQFADSAGLTQLAPDFRDQALAVALAGDTTWVGTPIGLFFAIAGQADLLEPADLREQPRARVPVVDLTWRGDTLVALTEQELLWRDPATGRFTLGPRLGGGLGRLHTVVSDARGLFVAGDGGVGPAQLQTPVTRTLRVGVDLPGTVTDLALDEDYLWVATLAGLVRFRLDAVR